MPGMALIERARGAGDAGEVVVSVFINPQFNDPRDLEAYPVSKR